MFSDPRIADSDGDSLPDGQELARGTDPRDPDTDDDGRIDGLESLSNPLRPDMSVTVTYAALHVTGSDDPPEWLWAFHVQGPTQSFPGTRVSSQAECPTALIGGCHCETYLRDIVLNKSVSVTLSPGEALVLNGAITDVYEDPNRSCPGGRSNAYEANRVSRRRSLHAVHRAADHVRVAAVATVYEPLDLARGTRTPITRRPSSSRSS